MKGGAAAPNIQTGNVLAELEPAIVQANTRLAVNLAGSRI
jgi:hypothetical protein